MKQFKLLILLLVIGFVAEAQINYLPMRSRYTWIAGKFDSTLHIPSGTTTSLRTGGYDYRGAVFYRTSDSTVYVYTGNQWISVKGAGGSSDSTIFATLYRLDTAKTNLRTSIATKLNISDTANMRPRLYAGTNVTITGTYPNLTIASSGSGGGSDTTLQLITDNGDSTTNRLVTSDSLKGLNEFINGSVTIGDTVRGTKQFIFFGNSVTAGYNLPSPTTERFSYLTSRTFGAVELNRGRSGTRLTHSGVSSDSCMIDRIPLIPTYASPYAAIFFDYGLNDDQAGVDTATFKTSYNRVIDTCIARGWPTNKIYLLAPSYNWYSLTPNTASFARATQTVAEGKSTKFVDVYNYMINNGGTSLIQADSLHPNALGNEVTHQAISQNIKTDFKRVGNLIVTGDHTTKGTIYFKSNATGTGGGLVALDDTNTGFGVLSGNSDHAYVINGGAPSVAFARNFMQGDANFQYAWTTGSSGGFAGGSDAGIAKQGAAALRVSNGSTGYGSMAASAFKTHGTTSGDVTVQSSTGTWTMTLPTSAGTSGYVLQTDGSGVTSWVAQSGGGGTTYKIGTYNSQTSSTNGAAIVSDSIYMQAFSAENPGLVPAGGSSDTYLKGNGTWATLPGGTGYVDSVSNNAGGDSLVVIKGVNRYAYKYPAGGSGLTIGTTAITSGTSRHLLFDSTGFVKENSYLQFNTSNQLLLRGGGPGASTPSIAAVNAPTTGIELWDATDGVSINVNGTREVAFFSSGILGDNGMVVGWNNTSSGAYGGGRNVGLTYGADKTVKVVDASTNLANINLGGLQTNYSSKTTTYTIAATDYTVTGDATSGAFTITLPTAASVAGKIYVIKKTDASGNAVTVGTTSSQTIDGSTTYSLATQYKYVVVQSNGSNWFIIGNN